MNDCMNDDDNNCYIDRTTYHDNVCHKPTDNDD